MLRKLVKPLRGLLLGCSLAAGQGAWAQTSGYVTPPGAVPPGVTIGAPVTAAPPASLGYAEPTTSAFGQPVNPTAPGVWFNIDYMVWWLKAAPAPGPLLTTGSLNDAEPGALGQPGTRVVFGDQGYSSNAFNGLRMNVGTWINEARTYGYEFGGFALEHKTTILNTRSAEDGSPFLARPYFNTQTGLQDIAIESLPGFQKGTMKVEGSTRFAGWDFNALINSSETGNYRCDALLGIRCLYLTENMSIGNRIEALVDQGPDENSLRQGERIGSIDRFQTASNFWGPQIGGRMTWVSDRWITTASLKVALGVTDEVAQLTAATASRGNGLGQFGFLVNGGNGGRYFDSKFSAIPEFGLNVGYRIGSYTTLRVGYTALYWSDVVRPGNVVPHAINPGLVPTLQSIPGGPLNQPRASIDSTDFWAQGLNLGIEFRF